jgi:hypothetical protein
MASVTKVGETHRTAQLKLVWPTSWGKIAISKI